MTSFAPLPRALKRAKLDNLVLVPASLLPYKAEYQTIANDLPPGATLVVMPKAPGKPGETLETVAVQLRARGHLVKIVPATRFAPTL